MIGTGLEAKFWSCAFMHVLRLQNAIPDSCWADSPLELLSGEKGNLKVLKTFGCCVWVRPSGIQAYCFKDKAWKGIFLCAFYYSKYFMVWCWEWTC